MEHQSLPVSTSYALLLLIAFLAVASAQSPASCSPSLTPTDSIQPSVASGYQVALVATGLSRPRSIQFDSAGNLLVVQSGRGLSSLQLQDSGGVCVSVQSQKFVLENRRVSRQAVAKQAEYVADIVLLHAA